jgi:hypothetical protein
MYRELGYHDFPLPAGKKAPPPVGWQRLAGKCEVPLGQNGVATDNYCVVDVDRKHIAREIYTTFKEHLTTVVETKNGAHFYFAGNIPCTKNNLGQHIDTRGPGGYVVGILSEVQGWIYKCVKGHPLVHVEELKPIPKLLTPKKVEIPSFHQINEPDPIRRIRRARAWLQRREPAVSSSDDRSMMGWHDQFFKVTCGLFQGFGLSMQEALPLIVEYNARCVPPFDDQAVMHKLTDAFKASQQQGA